MSDTKAEASRRDQSAIAVDGLNDHNVLNNVNDAKTSICICTDVPSSSVLNTSKANVLGSRFFQKAV